VTSGLRSLAGRCVPVLSPLAAGALSWPMVVTVAFAVVTGVLSIGCTHEKTPQEVHSAALEKLCYEKVSEVGRWLERVEQLDFRLPYGYLLLEIDGRWSYTTQVEAMQNVFVAASAADNYCHDTPEAEGLPLPKAIGYNCRDMLDLIGDLDPGLGWKVVSYEDVADAARVLKQATGVIDRFPSECQVSVDQD